MIPPGLLPHTAIRVRPATQADAYGNTVKDYGTLAARAGLACRFQQDQRTEHTGGRDATGQTWTMFTNQTDVAWDDRIEWDGHPTGPVVFEVWGPPEPVAAGTGPHHLEVTLRIQAG